MRTGKTLALRARCSSWRRSARSSTRPTPATSSACGTAATAHRRHAVRGRAVRVRRHPALLARALRARAPDRSAEAQAAEEGPGSAVRGGRGPAVLRPHAARARPGAGRGRRAAVRGDPVPPEVRVRRQRRLRAPALPARALDRGRAGEPGQVRAARLDHVGARRRGAAAGAVRQRLGDAQRHTGQPAAAVHRRRATGTRRAPAA